MSRASNRLLCVFIFAVITFVSVNIAYYQYCDKVAENALNEAIENHSEISEEEIMIAQFDEAYFEHLIKMQNESIN